MNRRTFIKIIGTILAVPSMLLGKARATPIVRTNDTGKTVKWLGFETFMDFYPDEIVCIDNYRDRLFVYCKHSIWEIEENCYGDGLQRKLITNI